MAVHARRRSATVTLGVTALLAAGLTGCGAEEAEQAEDPDYGAVCVDSQSQERVDDDRCDDDRGGGGVGPGLFAWYFLSRGAFAPAVGQRVSGGTFAQPGVGTIRRGGINRDGGTVTRGGFGDAGSSRIES